MKKVNGGLGWIEGDVSKFDFSCSKKNADMKIPHMGWNVANPKSTQCLFSNFDDEIRFYFVHSFHVNCSNPSTILATCNYGHEFTCAARQENIWGVQFHPEKSHRYGIQFFKNFIKVSQHAQL